jgi:hypothetical protein
MPDSNVLETEFLQDAGGGVLLRECESMQFGITGAGGD